jgi:hypothetical protein
MKKALFVFVLSLSLATMAKAQGEGFTFAAGLRLGLPIGDFADTHSFGVGVEVQGELGLSDKFSLVANTGFTQFFGKTIDVFGTSVKVDGVGLIPIIVGPRVYPSEKFFIGAQAGLGILTGGGSSETGFNWQPQIGVNTEHFQVALNYNALTKDGSTLGHVGLTALFKLGGAGAAHKK